MKRNSAIILTKIHKDWNDERKDEENNTARLEYTCHISDDTIAIDCFKKGKSVDNKGIKAESLKAADEETTK